MKLSIVISTHNTDFSALAFKSNLQANLKNTAQLGYDGVELAIRNPDDVDHDELIAMTEEYHLDVVALGTGQAYLVEGLSFTHPDKHIRNQAVERIREHIKLASRLNAMVIIGLLRGKVEQGLDRNQCVNWIKECFTESLISAQENKVTLLIEPLNRYEADIINTCAQAAELIEQLAFPNLKILMDTFHMNIEEVSIENAFRDYAGYLGHVHVADSNRWAPGLGHLNFAGIIDSLHSITYDGYLSAEIIPEPDPDFAAKQTLNHLRPMM